MDRYIIQNVGVALPQNAQQEIIIQKVEAYKQTLFQRYIFYFGCIVTFGLLYLVTRWQIRLWTLFLVQRCGINEADYFLLRAADKSITITKSIKQSMSIQGQQKLYTTFKFRFYKYYYDEAQSTFIPLEFNLSTQQNGKIIKDYHQGILEQEQLQELFNQFGPNSTAIPRKPISNVLIEEILNPFYLFQVFSIILWYVEDYSQYASIILLTSLFSSLEGLYDYYSNFKKLQQLAKSECQVKVFRYCDGLTFINKGKVEINEQVLIDKGYKLMSSKDLVPGDLIEIEDNQLMPCDVILLTGQSVMNEGMLTGESIPVMKSPLPYNTNYYNAAEDEKQSSLFAGTLCIETKISGKGRIPVLGLVTQTGFSTLKGQLIRSIMFTVQNSFKFYSDSLKFVAIFALLAVLGFLITLPARLQYIDDNGSSRQSMILDVLDLITITVPPALPTCLQIGISIALFRLKRKSIFCTTPFKINITGKITVMCFDKTGTLTEDGLDMYGARIVARNLTKKTLVLNTLSHCSPQLQQEDIVDDIVVYEMVEQQAQRVHTCSASNLVTQVMASCHGLTILKGKIIGDPLDVKVFETTKFKIQDEEEGGFDQIILPPEQNDQGFYKIEIVKKFEFSSKLQRMSVIAKTNEGFRIFVKGSPEKLRELCLLETIPQSFHQVLEFYAQNGFRVIACAARITSEDVVDLDRREVEQNLTFLGFIILENKLKPITIEVISHLQSANIRTIMVTGDNILTAISVARSCNIIQKDQRVFFGELEKVNKESLPKVTWKDFDRSSNQLNNDSLIPQQSQDNIIHNQLKTADDPEVNNQLKLEGYTLYQQRSLAQLDCKKSMVDLLDQDDPFPPNEYEKVDQEEVEPWRNTSDDFVLALSGAAFSHLLETDNNDALLQTLFERTQVYARMKPDEKGTLIKQLQTRLSRMPLVGFCGDGANDCAALKGADVGISLSPAEASIAASFTSQIQDISCVPILLCEGRAALTTSFTCFKYMAMYSIIQTASVCILQLSNANLTDGQFLYIDLFTIIPISMTMGFTHSRSKLNKYVPKGSLISTPVISSIVGQGIIQVMFQLVVYSSLIKQPWFVPARDLYHVNDPNRDYNISYETTSLFLFANLQYVFTVIAFSTGKPFRRAFYTNKYFTLVVFLVILVDTSLLLFYKNNQDQIYKYLGLIFQTDSTQVSKSWIVFLITMTILNSLSTVTYERLVVPKISKFTQNRKQL